MSIRALAIALFLAALPLAAQSAPNSAAAVLARVRAATLSRPLSSITSIRTTSAVVVVGLHGRSVEWDDVTNERTVQRITDSPAISGASGWDGKTSWSENESGIVRIDGGQSTRLQNIDQGYMAAFAYLRPAMGGASATFLGVRHDGANVYDVIELTPPGGTPLDLWIDATTNLIAKVESKIGITSQAVTYGDYHRVSGIEIPFHITAQNSNGNGFLASVASVAVNAPGLAAALRIPQSSAHDFSMAGGSSTTVPIHIINNHIYVHVMLDGKGPYTFIFDTGGAFIVTPAVAAALRERSTGSVSLSGVGANTEAAQFTRVNSIRIGSATIRNQDFVVLPIAQSFGIAEGTKIDGMFGPDIPDRFLTSIDYRARRLTLSMPGSATPHGAAVPFFFDGTTPRVPISVDGLGADAQLDTGNRGALEFFSPFLAAHPALAADATTADGVTGFGVGGPSFGKLGRVHTLRIGPFTLERVVAGFSTQSTGAFADPYTPANVGGGVWNRFTLTLDYPHQRVYLMPNTGYATPFTNDRSGLFLIDYHGGVMVLDARAGTPAASAGLRKGDMILTVNGKSASSYALPQLRALLSGPTGVVIRLRVRSGAAERDVTLTLRDYV
ncbi:MAG TPA: aspartyl protease family protein [Candidatus Tyrphobacter sp.]